MMNGCYMTYGKVGDTLIELSEVYQSILNQNEAF